MQLNVEELGTLKRKISVEVPLLEVEATYNEVYAQISQHISVRGFRPGKFPRQMAEKRFQDVMRQEATRSLLPKYFEQALEEMKARPATQPRFENLEIDKAQPFKFEAEFEIVPTFDLPEPSAFKLEEQQVELKGEEVDARVEELRKGRASLEDKGDAAAEEGDVVTIDFEGKLDGEPFDGNAAQDQRMELGSGQFLKDFETPLVGAKPGEAKSFDMTFPEEYGEQNLAGKEVHFEVKVKKVERKVLPEVDEAFYSQFGQFDSPEAFRENVEQQLRQEKERAIQMEYRQAIADQLRDTSSFEVPETLVEEHLHQFEHELSHSDPEALNDEKRLATLKEEEAERIRGNLRVNYLVDEWARRHEISVTKEEVQQRFYLQAYMMQQNPSELLNSPYGEQMIFQMEQQLLTNKVLEDLVARALGKEPPSEAAATAAAQAEPIPAEPAAGEEEPSAEAAGAEAAPEDAPAEQENPPHE